MSLKVWLPLINDIHNQGTSNCIPESSGISTNTAGKIGTCQYLSGAATSYINTNYSTNIGTNDFSIAMWLKLPTISSGTYYAICTSKSAAAASAGFGIYWNYSQKKFLWSTADGSAYSEIWMTTAVDSIVYDKWIHLVMVRDNSDSKKGYFYINGTRYELASTPVIRNISTDTKMYIGKCTNGNYPTKMYINDFRIYDHALSAAEVKEISQGLVLHYKLNDLTNGAIDSSGYGHHGNITGSLTQVTDNPVPARYSASYTFTGTQRITANTPNADIRTLSCWCRTTKNKSTSQHMVADSFSNMCISFYQGTIIGVFGSTRSTGSKSTLGTSYKENDWNHIVVVKVNDSGARDIYCNGVKLVAAANDYWSSANGFFVGARNASNGNAFYGEISDVRAYVTALDEDAIRQLYEVSAKIDNKQNIHTYELVEGNNKELLAVPLTTSYGNHSTIYTAYDNNGEVSLTGSSSVGSYYIPINPTGKTYYYDIEVSTDTGNVFYIGFQRYDANKTARSNDACVYLPGLTGSSEARTHKHYFGTVDLSTDGVNPCAFISLRILNDWSGANGRKATIHKISLREVTSLSNEKILKFGIFKADEFIEGQQVEIQKNKIVRGKNLIEF